MARIRELRDSWAHQKYVRQWVYSIHIHNKSHELEKWWQYCPVCSTVHNPHAQALCSEANWLTKYKPQHHRGNLSEAGRSSNSKSRIKSKAKEESLTFSCRRQEPCIFLLPGLPGRYHRSCLQWSKTFLSCPEFVLLNLDQRGYNWYILIPWSPCNLARHRYTVVILIYLASLWPSRKCQKPECSHAEFHGWCCDNSVQSTPLASARCGQLILTPPNRRSDNQPPERLAMLAISCKEVGLFEHHMSATMTMSHETSLQKNKEGKNTPAVWSFTPSCKTIPGKRMIDKGLEKVNTWTAGWCARLAADPMAGITYSPLK